MHRFTLQIDGGGECSVVMSQAPNPGDDTLADLAHDLLTALVKALPEFTQLAQTELTLDDTPAIELAYRWRKAFNLIRQRQIITLLPATEAETASVLLIAATCPEACADQWNSTVDALLNTVKLRHKAEAQASRAGTAPLAITSIVFALSKRRRTLHAFADQEEASSNIDAREVQQAEWLFFDSTGAALNVSFLTSSPWWRKPSPYVLVAQQGSVASSLQKELFHAERLVCSTSAVQLSSIAEVRAIFDNLTETDHAWSSTGR